MGFWEAVKERVLLYDGAKSALIGGLLSSPTSIPDLLTITNPGVVKDVYGVYIRAGSDCIQTLTYNSNRVRLKELDMDARMDEIIDRGIGLAHDAAGDKCFVIATAGPLGKLLRPVGDLTVEMAYELFAEQMSMFDRHGADAIHLDAFKSMKELKIALLAARENTHLPIICGMSLEKNGKTIMGEDVCSVAVTMSALGADMISVSDGDGAGPMVKYASAASQSGRPLCIKPNAGTPYIVGDRLVSPDSEDAISLLCDEYIKSGARLIGGAFGTTPRTIELLREKLDNTEMSCWNGGNEPAHPWLTGGSSRVRTDREFKPLSVDEIIGPEPVIDLDDMFDVIREISAHKFDVVYLDVDKAMDEDLPIEYVLGDMQSYIKRPIVFKSEDRRVLEKAIRCYNGRPGVVVNSEASRVLAHKYGCIEFDAALC